MKKALSILLSIVLVFSLCVPAFAENERVYKNYVALGDSIPAGTGIEGYRTGVLEWTPNTYPTLVRDALDADGEFSFDGAHCGMRVREMCIALMGEEWADDYTYNFFNTDAWARPGALDTLLDTDYAYYVSNADLITVQFGSNELLGVLIFHLEKLMMSLSAESDLAPYFEEAIEKANQLGDASAILVSLLETLKSVANTAEMIYELLTTAAANIMENSLSQILTTWDAMMGELIRLNPTADILCLTIYNPIVSFAPLLGLEPERIESITQPIFDALNYEIEYGSDFRALYTVVDTSPLVLDLLAGHTSDGVHPDAVGHERLKELILEELSKLCRHKNKNTLFATKPSFFHDGYTGDVFCADCGKQLEQGAIVTKLGQKIDIPSALGYQLVEKILSSVLGGLSDMFNAVISSVAVVK